MRPDRRRLLAGIPGALLAACTSGSRGRGGVAVQEPPGVDYLAHARGAARFIRTLAVPTPHGLTWSKSPEQRGEHEADLYHGSAGPALFFVELHRATGERAALDEALAGAAHLVATWPEKPSWAEIGLYGG